MRGFCLTLQYVDIQAQDCVRQSRRRGLESFGKNGGAVSEEEVGVSGSVAENR